MKSFIALSFVLLGLFTSYTLQTALGNFSVAVKEHQRTGAYLKDVARTAFLNNRAPDEPITVPMQRAPDPEIRGVYYAEIGFGEPAKFRKLLVDSGSPITWFANYVESATSRATFRVFYLNYVEGHCRADEFLDQVTIAPNLVIPIIDDKDKDKDKRDQAIGAAIEFTYLDGLEGILGLGPVVLTKGSIPLEPDAMVPTVMNTLKSRGLISKEIFSIYFPPTVFGDKDDQGKLTFGGVDESLYEDEMRYVPLTKKAPSSRYWGVNLISCTYGSGDSEKIILGKSDEDPVAGVIDTGAIFIHLAQDMFEAYMAAIPGATYDEEADLIEIPPESIEDMQPLYFKIGDHVFTLDANDQLLPPEMSEVIDGNRDKRYGSITSSGPDTHSGSGNGFTLGVGFMKVYYTVFDADNKRLGFAKAK